MRLLIVSHYALPHTGGIEVAVDGMARALLRAGHEVVHVASSAARGAAATEAPPYRVERVPAFNGFEARLHVPYPLFGPRLRSVLRAELARADAVHAHGLLYQGTLAALALRRRGQRVVVTEHVGHVPYENPAVDAVERGAFATVGRAAARAADALVVLNPGVEALARRLAPGTPVHTIFNGVDAEAYRPPGPGEREALRARLGWDERPRVLFVGRLVEKKGLPLALDAHAAADGAWELAVAGPGTPPEPRPGVQLLGELDRARVAELYRAADAFLLPSHGEGFPITVQEALASGLPAVLLDDANHVPYLDPGRRAVRTSSGDAGALAAAVAEAVADTGARELAARHAREQFSWDAAAEAHLRLLRGLPLP